MNARQLFSVLVIAGALVSSWSQASVAASPTTYFGMAVVTAITSACASGKWIVGRQMAVNYREDTLLDPLRRPALRFNDSTFTLVASQGPSGSWSSPTGSGYEAEISGLDVAAAVNFTGHALLQLWTSSTVPNARYMNSGTFTNWANIPNCTLTLRATMIQR